MNESELVQASDTNQVETDYDKMRQANKAKIHQLWEEGITGITIGEDGTNIHGLIFNHDAKGFSREGQLYFISADGSYVARIRTEDKSKMIIPTDSSTFDLGESVGQTPQEIAAALHKMEGGEFHDSNGPNYDESGIDTPSGIVERAYSVLRANLKEKRLPTENEQKTVTASHSHLETL